MKSEMRLRALSFSLSLYRSFFSPWHGRQHIQATRTPQSFTFSLTLYVSFQIDHILSIPCCLLLSRTVWIIYSLIVKCNIDSYNKQVVNTEYSIFNSRYGQLSCSFLLHQQKLLQKSFMYTKK